MKKHRYADILIVTALLEEQFLLDSNYPEALEKAFKDNAKSEVGVINVPGIIGKQVLIKFNTGKELCIAWATLGDEKTSDGNSMGNIFAYNSCIHLAEHFCPRFILLLGIAGGSQNVFERGDVGFGITTGYSTYCKLETGGSITTIVNNSKTLSNKSKSALLSALRSLKISQIEPSLKYVPRKVPFVASSENFCAIARNNRTNTEWPKLAKSWFKQRVKEFNDKQSTFDISLATPQKMFDRKSPIAVAGIVASGDAIIANVTIQKDIENTLVLEDRHSKLNLPANMFEMESFGVGLFCNTRNIEYGMIKGICDMAGKKKNDEHRLCALCSASAFALKIITNEGFYKPILENKAHRTDSGMNACIWPHNNGVYKRCVDSWLPSPEKLLTSHRPCTDTDLVNVKGSTELPGARVFQQAESTEYSKCVSDFVDNRIGFDHGKDKNRLLFLFPYSVYDLLNFLRNTGLLDTHDVKRVLSLQQCVQKYGDDKKVRPKTIIEHATHLGKMAYDLHPHFDAANAMCAQWIASGKKTVEIAQKVCRVISICEEDRHHLENDPRYLLHIFMCGLCVPTLIASKATLITYGADEATYFNYKCLDDNHERNQEPVYKNKTLCLKYSDRSKLLTLLGRCDDLPSPCFDVKLFKMFDNIEKWIVKNLDRNRPRKPSGKFEVFPLLNILKRHNISWKNAETLVPNYKMFAESEQKNIDDYFTDLTTWESPLQ